MRKSELVVNVFCLFGPMVLGLLFVVLLSFSCAFRSPGSWYVIAIAGPCLVLGVVLYARLKSTKESIKPLGCLIAFIGVPAIVILVIIISINAPFHFDKQQLEQSQKQHMSKQFAEIREGKRTSLYLCSVMNLEELTDDPEAAARVESIGVMGWPDVSHPHWSLLKKLPNVKRLHFYDCGNIDPALSNIRGMASLDQLCLSGGTPLSNEGMASLALFSNLKELNVVGPVSDAGLAQLRGHPNLERLELIRNKMTNNGLAVLKDIPKLRHLVIEWDASQAACQSNEGTREVIGFTDAGLVHLKDLKNLMSLNLNGGWTSDEAVEDLRKALPNCTITTCPDAITW